MEPRGSQACSELETALLWDNAGGKGVANLQVKKPECEELQRDFLNRHHVIVCHITTSCLTQHHWHVRLRYADSKSSLQKRERGLHEL